jgi:hypothetical protein
MPPGQPAFAMEINATTSVTKPAIAQSATNTRHDLGRFTSFSAPPVPSFSSPDLFQVEPFNVESFRVDLFHVEPFQVSRFHDDKARAACTLTVCPI